MFLKLFPLWAPLAAALGFLFADQLSGWGSAIVVALNADNLRELAIPVVLATLLHNVSGLALGYLAAHLLGFEKAVCRTIAIEVGMQNSGLATALAVKFFAPVTALPGALFSVWLNITGSIFATVSVRFDKKLETP